MKRNFLLFLAVLVSIILVVNGTKRLLTFRTTAQKIKEIQMRLEGLKQENESLKRELEYKKSNEFAEAEIRNKLGLVKEGETVVIVPQKDRGGQPQTKDQEKGPNWRRWWNLFFGS